MLSQRSEKLRCRFFTIVVDILRSVQSGKASVQMKKRQILHWQVFLDIIAARVFEHAMVADYYHGSLVWRSACCLRKTLMTYGITVYGSLRVQARKLKMVGPPA